MIESGGHVNSTAGGGSLIWSSSAFSFAGFEYAVRLSYNNTLVYPSDYAAERFHGFPLRCLVR